MTTYLVFAGVFYYPAGGITDLVLCTVNEQEAWEYFDNLDEEEYDWAQFVKIVSGEVQHVEERNYPLAY